jgi:hypothetical protein
LARSEHEQDDVLDEPLPERAGATPNEDIDAVFQSLSFESNETAGRA